MFLVEGAGDTVINFLNSDEFCRALCGRKVVKLTLLVFFILLNYCDTYAATGN